MGQWSLDTRHRSRRGGRWRAVLLSLAVAAVCAGGAGAGEQLISVGLGKSIAGLLLVNRADGRQERVQTDETLSLFEGDEVKTGPRAQALIQFDDGTRVALNESTTFVIRSRQPKDSGIVRVLKMILGELWVRAGRDPRPLEVETPSAIAAIRGTEFNLKVHESGRSELAVATGQVQFGNVRRTYSVPVGAGMGSVGERGKRPTPPARVDAQKVTAWARKVANLQVLRPQGPTKAPAPGGGAGQPGSPAGPGGDPAKVAPGIAAVPPVGPGGSPGQQISRLPTPGAPPAAQLLLAGKLIITPSTNVSSGTALRFSGDISARQGTAVPPGSPVSLRVEGPGDWVSQTSVPVPAPGHSTSISFGGSYTVPANAGDSLCFRLKVADAGQAGRPDAGRSLAEACVKVAPRRGSLQDQPSTPYVPQHRPPGFGAPPVRGR